MKLRVMRCLGLVDFILALLLVSLPLMAFGQAQMVDFERGESKLYWSGTDIELNADELKAVKYKNGHVFKVSYQVGDRIAAGFKVENGKIVEESHGSFSVEKISCQLENPFIRGMSYGSTDPSYRLDRVEVEVQRGGQPVVGGKITLRGVEEVIHNPHEFYTWNEKQTVDLLLLPNGTGNVKFITKCYISRRKGPFSIKFAELGVPPPNWFRILSMSGLIASGPLEVLLNPEKDAYHVWEGTLLGYGVKKAKEAGKESRPYTPGTNAPALRPLANPLEVSDGGYRTWLVTGNAEFKITPFVEHTIEYEPNPTGATIAVHKQNEGGGKYDVAVPSGGKVFEGLQLKVTVTLTGECNYLEGKTLQVQGSPSENYSLKEIGNGKYETLVLVKRPIANLQLSLRTRQYTVAYEKSTPGPNATIGWVRIGGITGSDVNSGGTVHCGEELYVRFEASEGYRVKDGTTVALVGANAVPLVPFDVTQGIYRLPREAFNANVTAIRCDTEPKPLRQITVLYVSAIPEYGMGTILELKKNGLSLPSGGKILQGETVHVFIRGLRGKVRPSKVTIRYATATPYEHTTFAVPVNNELVFPVALSDDVVGIDVEYALQTVSNTVADRLTLLMNDGYVIDAQTGRDLQITSGQEQPSSFQTIRGTLLTVNSKGVEFPEDSYVSIEGGEPATIATDQLPSQFEVVDNTKVGLKLGVVFMQVQYEQPTVGAFALLAEGSVQVKKGSGQPAVELSDGQEVSSGWRVAADSKLRLEEKVQVDGRLLRDYTVTMGGVETTAYPGTPITITGAVTKIVPNYVVGYRILYQREGVGYSLMEVRKPNGELVADGALVPEGVALTVKVNALENFICEKILLNQDEHDYSPEGVVFTPTVETRIVPQMKEVRKFSILWTLPEGIDMEVRLGSTTGEEVPPGVQKGELYEGMLVYVRASRDGQIYQGVRVNGATPADLHDAGYWYSFPLLANVTSIEPLWQEFQEPGEGQTKVQYAYVHAEVQVHRMENGIRVPVPNHSLVPHGTDLIITITKVSEGYRFACIVANDKVAVVEDTYNGVYSLNVGDVANYNIDIRVERPHNAEPRYIMVRKDGSGEGQGEFVVYVERNGEARALAPGEPHRMVAGDRYRAKIAPATGHELAQSVFKQSGSGVILREDGEIDIDPTAEPKALYLLWVTFRPVPPKFTITWQTDGEGSVQVFDLAGGLVEKGAQLPDHTEVVVVATPAEGYKMALFTANGLSMVDASELESGKLSKRLSVVTPTQIYISFVKRTAPPAPLPKPEPHITDVVQPFSGVRLYPVPLSDWLYIANAQGALRCAVYDMSGRALLSEQVEGASEAQVDVSRLASGVYVIVLEGQEGRRAFRVVK